MRRIPAYLDVFAQAGTFEAGVQEALAPGSLMLSDPALLLHDQLKEPYIYESVLASLASGFHVWTQIAKMARISEGSLGFYLTGLQALELVERRDPILSSPAGRKSRYFVKDPFLRFYYRFIQRHITSIERGELAPVLAALNHELRAFIGAYVFEELCREWVISPRALKDLEFLPETVGSFWTQNRGEGVQLDVVAANSREKRLFIGEAKWGQGNLSRSILTNLVKQSQRMAQIREGWQVKYRLFARDAFTAATSESVQELEEDLIQVTIYSPAQELREINF